MNPKTENTNTISAMVLRYEEKPIRSKMKHMQLSLRLAFSCGLISHLIGHHTIKMSKSNQVFMVCTVITCKLLPIDDIGNCLYTRQMEPCKYFIGSLVQTYPLQATLCMPTTAWNLLQKQNVSATMFHVCANKEHSGQQ